MVGLVNTQINPKDPLKSFAGYKPEKLKFGPEDTVENRALKIIQKDSPFMQQAATRARQASNRRGLINSSMAVEAGQKALLDAALPIASQDAQTSFASKRSNQDAINKALEFTSGVQTQGASQQLAGMQDLDKIRATGAEDRLGIIERGRQDRLGIGTTGEQERLNIGARTASESSLLEQKRQIDRDLLTADADQKERLMLAKGEIDKQLQELIGGQEIGSIAARGEQERLTVGSRADAEANLLEQKRQIDLELQTADAANRESLLQAQGEIDKQLLALQGEQQLGTIAAQGVQQRLNIVAQTQSESDLMDQRGKIDLEIQSADAETREKLLEVQGAIDNKLQVVRGMQEMEIQGLRGEQAENIAKIENEYRMLLQANQSAGGFFATTAAAISDILKNPDMKVATKNDLIKRQTELLHAGLEVISGITNSGIDGTGTINLNSLLDYSGSGNSPVPTAGGSDGSTPPTTGGTGGQQPGQMISEITNAPQILAEVENLISPYQNFDKNSVRKTKVALEKLGISMGRLPRDRGTAIEDWGREMFNAGTVTLLNDYFSYKKDDPERIKALLALSRRGFYFSEDPMKPEYYTY